MPWMASKACQMEVQRIVGAQKYPAKFGGTVKTLFTNPGSLKAIDWINLASPLGCDIISLQDIDDVYKRVRIHRVFNSLLNCVNSLPVICLYSAFP